MTKRTNRVLLLGGGGYMGRAFATRLLQLGYDVHVVVRGALLDLPAAVTVHGGGMENIGLLQTILPTCASVVHMASGTTPGLSNRAPSLEARNNLGPSLDFLEVLQLAPRVRLVYVSSGGTVYGNPRVDPVPESSPLEPLSFYGCGKACLEEFLRCFARMSGTPLTILRPSNLYGPGQPRYQGFGVIRTMLQHLLDGTIMPVWGDGSITRDFVYIDDMVAALECVLAEPEATGTFNVGSGAGCSLNELIVVVERVCGRRLAVEYGAARGIDVKRIVLDIAAIGQRFGWTPRTSLEQGLAKTWEWLKTQSNPA